MSDIRFLYKTAVVLRSGNVFSKGEVVAIEVVQADNSQGFVYRCTKDGKCDLINQQLLHRYVL